MTAGAPSPRTRRKRTSRRVRFAERASRIVISAGGIGTIAAVCGIMVFLVVIVAPLFRGADLDRADERARTAPPSSRDAVHLAVDEEQRVAAAVHADGSLEVIPLQGEAGSSLVAAPAGPAPTAWAFGTADEIAVGYADGTVRLGRLVLAAKGAASAELVLEEPTKVFEGRAVVLLDAVRPAANRVVFAALSADGGLVLVSESFTENLMSGERDVEVSRSTLPNEPAPSGAAPAFLRISGVGDMAVLAWRDGRAVRFDARDRDRPLVAEVLDLVEQDGATLTRFDPVLGRTTFVAGDSTGKVRAWFVVRGGGAATSDGGRFVVGHDGPHGRAPVSALAPSSRMHLVAQGFADGTVRLVYVTTERSILEVRAPEGPPRALTVLLKDTLEGQTGAVLALTEGRLHRWQFRPGHPDAGMKALFGKVWYEGFPRPEHVWQSSGGAEFEPKLGLVPLIFGTLKATFYSMLFGVPLAILAALFTSEFLHARLRTSVKSTIEIMASLPSVVLGFLAATIIAPFVQRIVPTVLTAFLTIPFALMLGAGLWQLLPQRWAVRLSGAPRFAAICAALPLGILAAAALGPRIEAGLFGGDLLRWLSDRRFGSALGGWAMLLVPLGALAAAVVVATFVSPVLRRRSVGWSRGVCAVVDLAKLVLGALIALAVAFGLAGVLSWSGLDARGTLVDTYVQRNALVVGFVMGFAIIPIIYTLAEDALASVPRHLREASLGAGATPWQTATRVVVPTALSGIFSALMIGLGRAVGETMIVLMAAGNTAVMELNPLSGLRTLSANTAVEMPEAVRDSTHYRTLFLGALCLFAMTFVLNTMAEAVRQRFRRRAFQL